MTKRSMTCGVAAALAFCGPSGAAPSTARPAAFAAERARHAPEREEARAILVEMRLIQVDFARLAAIEAEEGRDLEIPEDWGVKAGMRIRAGRIEWKPPVLLLGDEGELRIGERVFRLSDAAPGGPFTVLSAPSLLCGDGQRATISMGEPVHFLERGDDGCLRVADESPLLEGVTIEVTPSLDEQGTLEIDPIDVQLRTVNGREPIAGVPLDVGRPIFEERRAAQSMRIGADDVAAMPLMPIGEGERDAIFVVVTAKPAEE